MQIVAHALRVGREEVGLGGGQTRLLDDRLHRAVDAVELVERVDVGHVARVQDVVEVLEEALALDLRVAEEEDGLRVAEAGGEHDLLEVVAPLLHAVVLGELDLEAVVLGHVGREARERLAARAAHAQQQRVPKRLPK